LGSPNDFNDFYRPPSVKTFTGPLQELARGADAFGVAHDKLFTWLDKLAQLDAKLTELRAIDDQHRVIDMPSPLRPRSVN